MKVINVEPNEVILIKEIFETDGKIKVKFLDVNGIEKEAKLTIENDNDKKRSAATFKDWNVYMNMLSETAVTSIKLKEIESVCSKEVDVQLNNITSRFSTEPENITTLIAEMQNITNNKVEIVNNMVQEEVEKLKEESRNRKSFFIGGITIFDNNDVVSREIEIPKPTKTARNVKTISSYDASINYSFTFDGKPLKVADINNIDISKVFISGEVAHTNSNTKINKIFAVNENCIDGLSSTKGEMLYKKLLDVYGKSDAAKELLTFKKENPFESLTSDKIEILKSLYNNVRNDILTNGMSGYSIKIKFHSDNFEKQRLLERMVKGLSNGVMKKLTNSNELPGEVELTNINGMHKFPTLQNGELNNQWYSSITTLSKEKITNISAPETSNGNENFSSNTIQSQIREIVLKEKNLEISNNEDIGR